MSVVVGQALEAFRFFLRSSPPSLAPCSHRRPACRVFVASSLCCMDYGIVQHASVRLWLVCNADVYLPEPKCLTGELLGKIALNDVRCQYAHVPGMRVAQEPGRCNQQALPTRLSSAPTPTSPLSLLPLLLPGIKPGSCS